MIIQQLCQDIEKALNRQMQTPKDFDFLHDRIYARLHVQVSSTTLKRIWGYLQEDVKPRETTLGLLAQFLGYSDLEEYQHNSSLPKEQQSNPVMSRRLSVSNELQKGDCLRLTWQPDRVCDIEYLGNLSFRVLSSENTRLREGNVFQCSLIIDGEPLYLDNLIQGNQPPIAYVCGKKSGVLFEYL